MKRFSNILCVVDPAVGCDAVLGRTAALAETNQASLTVAALAPAVRLMPGIPLGTLGTEQGAAAVLQEHQAALDGVVAGYADRVDIRTRVLSGIPFIEIVRQVLREGHDLVVKAPEAPGWVEQLFGSDDMHLLRKCPCPVWLVRCDATGPFRRILAAVDADESYPAEELALRRALNRQVLELAASLALSEFAELHVAHAWEAVGEGSLRGAFLNAPEAEVVSYVEEVRRVHARNLNDLMRELGPWVGEEALEYLNPRKHLVQGWARKEIPELTRTLGIDLIVMGTVGRTGIAGFFIGNTAETILSQIDCSVLAAKPPGFQSPVTLEE